LEKELQATERQQAELKEKIKKLEAEKEEWRVGFISRRSIASKASLISGKTCRSSKAS
jgi:hypothetical protein